MEGVSLNLVETWDEAQSFMSWLGESRPVLACDTETGGLDWWKDDLRLVQFGDLQTGWAIPWHQWGGLVKEALARYMGPLVFHNAKFDIKYLEQFGCDVRRGRIHDTRSMAHLLDPANPTGLKRLATRFIDPSANQGESDLKRGMAENRWTWATVPVSYGPYWVYSALDPVLTAHLYQKFRPQIIGGLDDVYELEIACLLVLNDIERRGARVDVPYCVEKQEMLLDVAARTRAWVEETYGFGAGSNKQVAAALQADGVVLSKRTESGGWSMDLEVLSELDHPLARAVLNVRKTEKMATAYFGGYIERAVDGMLHPDINPLGARTGRMSVSKPALQQIPRTKLLRSPFIPRDGNLLVSVDFDQIEMRLMTHFSQDEGLLAAFQGEGDFFTNMARQIFHDNTIEKSDPRRPQVKNASYAKAYGAGVSKFARTAKTTEAEAQQFLSTYDAAFPGVKRFQKEIEHEAQQRANTEGLAYVTTPLGRRQTCEVDQLYKLVNYKLQGTAADIFKQTLVDLDRAGLADNIILPVHDEMVADVAAADAVDFATEVVRVFEKKRGWETVPFTAGSDILKDWGTKYE